MNANLKILERLIRLEAIRKATAASDVFERVRNDMQATLGMIHGANRVAAQADQTATSLVASAFKVNEIADRAEKASGLALDVMESVAETSEQAKQAQKLAAEAKTKAEAIVADLGKSLANVGETERKVVSIAEAVDRKLGKERAVAGEAKKAAEKAGAALEELLPLVKRIEYREDRWLWALYSDGSESKIVRLPKQNVFGGMGLLPTPGTGTTASPYQIIVSTSSVALSATQPTLLLMDATSADLTVTLTVAANSTADHIIQKIDSSTHTVTVTGDNVNGDGDAIISKRNTAIHLYPTPANGWRIG